MLPPEECIELRKRAVSASASRNSTADVVTGPVPVPGEACVGVGIALVGVAD